MALERAICGICPELRLPWSEGAHLPGGGLLVEIANPSLMGWRPLYGPPPARDFRRLANLPYDCLDRHLAAIMIVLVKVLS